MGVSFLSEVGFFSEVHFKVKDREGCQTVGFFSCEKTTLQMVVGTCFFSLSRFHAYVFKVLKKKCFFLFGVTVKLGEKPKTRKPFRRSCLEQKLSPQPQPPTQIQLKHPIGNQNPKHTLPSLKLT